MASKKMNDKETLSFEKWWSKNSAREFADKKTLCEEVWNIAHSAFDKSLHDAIVVMHKHNQNCLFEAQKEHEKELAALKSSQDLRYGCSYARQSARTCGACGHTLAQHEFEVDGKAFCVECDCNSFVGTIPKPGSLNHKGE